MESPVLIETTSDGGFRARTGDPVPLTAEAATRDGALAELAALLDERLANGAELVSLPVGAPQSLLPAGAGMFKDDPMFDEWQEAIAEYRRQKDAEEGIE